MKRSSKAIGIMVLLCALCFGFQGKAEAVWTLTVSGVAEAGHYIKWKVLCTGDGGVLTATDLVALMPTAVLNKVQGNTLLAIKVYPGVAGVIPDNTFDVTLSDDESHAIWASTAISKDTFTWFDMSKDIKIYPPVTGKLYLTISDIGTAGDQVTLYFITWKEDR